MKKLLAAAALSLAFSGLAQAATLTYTGTNTVTLNNFDLTATTGLSNGTSVFHEKFAGQGLVLNGPSRLTLTYLGSEAGHTNVFRMPTPTDVFRTGVTAVGASVQTGPVASGVLSFSFFDLVACLGIKNGQGNYFPINSIGVFMESATSALVLFNDLGHDRDFDDMAVRIQVSPVPVPAALPLLLTGLGGLGYFARRRRAKS